MNRSVGVLVLVLLLTASGIIAMLTYERNATTARLQESEAAQHKLTAELEILRAERDRLRKQLQQQTEAATQLALEANSRKPAPASAPASGISAGGKSAEAGGAPAKRANPLAEMMKNPAMKDMMKQQQIAQLDMQYGKLFSQFHLTDEEKADFKQLLADRLLRRVRVWTEDAG